MARILSQLRYLFAGVGDSGRLFHEKVIQIFVGFSQPRLIDRDGTQLVDPRRVPPAERCVFERRRHQSTNPPFHIVPVALEPLRSIGSETVTLGPPVPDCRAAVVPRGVVVVLQVFSRRVVWAGTLSTVESAPALAGTVDRPLLTR